ncbi:MAG: efflux RND transporter periplasmic adaptor subunit [Cyclobacteriaceae bacterium]|nr:efflux RND transporter periplasmic adaptor subunit [Cyclobacteriaceae bacterium]
MNFKIKHIAILLALGGVIVACSGNEKENQSAKEAAVPVTVGSVSTQATNYITTSGQVTAKETAVISTRVMGFITGFKVKVGDQVQKGQLLVTINNADILAKRAQAQAMITEAETALKDAQKDYERYEELYRQKSASTKEFENVTLHYHSVKAKVEAAHQMKNEADAMLIYTNLTAPFSGVVTQRNLDEGSLANPGTPILMVEQVGGYEVRASVSEADIAHIKTGTVVEVEVKSTGKKYTGKIVEVSTSSQYSGGQYMIKVSLSSQQEVFTGMYVTVSIPIANAKTNEKNILIPTSALIYKDQLVGIYTISESNQALLRWLKLGKTTGDKIEVLSGLNVDEKFILQSEGKLYNGAPIRVK